MKISLKTLMMASLFLSGSYSSAQETALNLGVRSGGGISVNPGIDGILVPEDYYSNYTFMDKWQAVPTLGVFVLYHCPLSAVAFEGGIGFWQKASRLVYDDREELRYTVTPRYSYLGVSAFVKVYPFRRGFSIALGGRAGANLNSKSISYDSNQEDDKFSDYHFATVAETDRLMKEKLTGNPDVAIGGGLGYDVGRHWGIDLRYFYGLTSTIKTETNTFNWVEKPTHSHNIELTVSYLFNL